MLSSTRKTFSLVIWITVFLCARGYGVTESNLDFRLLRGAPVQLTATELAWVNAHPEIRWGADPDWPPFSMLDTNHQMAGIDADIVHLATRRVGLRVTVVPGNSWSEVLTKAKAGEVDFLSATAKTPERLEAFDYTKQYGSFPEVIITREDAPFMTPAADLDSLKISTTRDHVITSHLQQDYPTARLVLTDTAGEAIQLVSRGKVDATVQNLAVACRVIRVNGLTNLKIAGVTRYEFPLHIAVRKDMPELRAILDKGLATITPDEEERIYARHLTPDIAKARNWGAWRRRAIDISTVGAAAIGMAGLWNWCLTRQIQRRKVAEAALRDARDKLEQRTHELDDHVEEVERLNAELRTANGDLESFSSSVSHDLRAPLRRLTGFAQLLRAETGHCSQDEAGQWMNAIIKESGKMDRLTRDLLGFARLGRAELHKQPVNLRELVHGVIDDFQPQVADRNVVWKIGELGEADGDPNLLRYAFSNLIDNALKYSRRRPETQIKIGTLPNESERNATTFYVQDNGCGFDMSHAKNLFSPFQRLHSDKDYEGTGIGLASVQRIIQKHGGRIWFESEPDKGTTFYFTLTRFAQQAYSA